MPEVDASEQMDLFSPFTALTGYDAVLQEAGRLTTLQKELDEGVQAELDKPVSYTHLTLPTIRLV